jgi:hypothetical protein
MKSYFLVNGYKVEFHADSGLAEFHRMHVLVRVSAEQFTYDWVVKTEFKLQALLK